ncbi:MAG: hypothetical protein ABI835_10895 [Chloroflexota bacterium]
MRLLARSLVRALMLLLIFAPMPVAAKQEVVTATPTPPASVIVIPVDEGAAVIPTWQIIIGLLGSGTLGAGLVALALRYANSKIDKNTEDAKLQRSTRQAEIGMQVESARGEVESNRVTGENFGDLLKLFSRQIEAAFAQVTATSALASSINASTDASNKAYIESVETDKKRIASLEVLEEEGLKASKKQGEILAEVQASRSDLTNLINALTTTLTTMMEKNDGQSKMQERIDLLDRRIADYPARVDQLEKQLMDRGILPVSVLPGSSLINPSTTEMTEVEIEAKAKPPIPNGAAQAAIEAVNTAIDQSKAPPMPPPEAHLG